MKSVVEEELAHQQEESLIRMNKDCVLRVTCGESGDSEVKYYRRLMEYLHRSLQSVRFVRIILVRYMCLRTVQTVPSCTVRCPV